MLPKAGSTCLGTFLPFTCDIRNGSSDQKPTLNVRPTDIPERQTWGRQWTFRFRVLQRPEQIFAPVAVDPQTPKSGRSYRLVSSQMRDALRGRVHGGASFRRIVRDILRQEVDEGARREAGRPPRWEVSVDG